MTTKIKCPECQHEFDVEAAISHELEHGIRKELEGKYSKEFKNLAEMTEQLRLQKEKLDQNKEAQDKLVKELVKKESKKLKEEIESEVKKENTESIDALKKMVDSQRSEISKSRKEKLLIEEQVSALKQKAEQMDIEIREKVLAQTEAIKEDLKKTEQQKHHLELKQRDELVNSMKEQLEEMKRKAEQGSMQAQGEILELEVERILQAVFPMDQIEEIKKGTNGADCLHHVINPFGRVAGTIAFESKRTKSFSDNWIEKLKADMRIHKAEIGVIVTESMPTDMPNFGLRDGIFICRFSEVEGLSRVLRHSLLNVFALREANENRGDKMQVLYSYLISEEFKQQMEAIVRGFVNMKSSLEAEKRSMKRIWKQREKELDSIIDGATGMHGSLRAIAGNSIAPIAELEMDQPTLIDEE